MKMSVQITNAVFQWTQNSEIAEIPKNIKIVMSIIFAKSFIKYDNVIIESLLFIKIKIGNHKKSLKIELAFLSGRKYFRFKEFPDLMFVPDIVLNIRLHEKSTKYNC